MSGLGSTRSDSLDMDAVAADAAEQQPLDRTAALQLLDLDGLSGSFATTDSRGAGASLLNLSRSSGNMNPTPPHSGPAVPVGGDWAGARSPQPPPAGRPGRASTPPLRRIVTASPEVARTSSPFASFGGSLMSSGELPAGGVRTLLQSFSGSQLSSSSRLTRRREADANVKLDDEDEEDSASASSGDSLAAFSEALLASSSSLGKLQERQSMVPTPGACVHNEHTQCLAPCVLQDDAPGIVPVL